MQNFVDRKPELTIVEEAIDDLQNKERLLKTPIIDFYGVEGIGKTQLLMQINKKCAEEQVPRIWATATKTLPEIEQSIIDQAERYLEKSKPLHTRNVDQSGQTAIEYTKALLDQGPAVMLLDAIDSTDEDQLQWLEKLLSGLAIYSKFFVVLSSRQSIPFEKEKSIARRLTLHPIQPLDRDSSEKYLEYQQPPFKPEMRNIIFEWTQGYPAAMNAMISGITQEKFDPLTTEGSQQLIKYIIERVITNGLLKHIKPEEQEQIQRLLFLLAIPRRLNLVIMQKLIEEFEPDLKMGSTSLSYMVLPNKINQAMGIFTWKQDKAGYCIEEPVRHLLLLAWQIEQPERYRQINLFLAQLHQYTSVIIPGPDHIRNQREYLYHSANSLDPQQLEPVLNQTLQGIVSDAEQNPEWLVQFVEEFKNDKELHEALGEQTEVVQNFLRYPHLANIMFAAYEQEENSEKRFNSLLASFYYAVQDSANNEQATKLRDQLQQLLSTESPSFMLKLYEKLYSDTRFQSVLGEYLNTLHTAIQVRISEEG